MYAFLLKVRVVEILVAGFPDPEYDSFSYTHKNSPVPAVCIHIWLISNPYPQNKQSNIEEPSVTFTFSSAVNVNTWDKVWVLWAF